MFDYVKNINNIETQSSGLVKIEFGDCLVVLGGASFVFELFAAFFGERLNNPSCVGSLLGGH